VTLSLTVALAGCVAYAPAPLSVADLAKPAAVSSPLPSDAHDLLKLALDRDPALAAARASLLAAEHAAKSARNLPPLNLTLTAEYSKEADATRPWLYGGSIGVPVDAGGRRAARVTTADIAVVKARYAVAEAAWKVRQQLRQALADLATARMEMTAAQDLVDQRRAYQILIERRAAAGEDPQSLAVQARLDASTPLDSLMQAQARQAQAKAALARLLNVPLGAIDTLALNLPAEAPLDIAQLQTLSDRAFYVRAEVLTAVADYDVAENDLRAAIAGQYPDLNIAPGYTWERGVVKVPLNLSFTLPPLDLNRANIAQAQAARLAAGKTLEDQVKTVQADIRQASLTYAADRATAVKARDNDLPMALDLSQRLTRMQAAGEADRTEVLTADIASAQTRLSLATAERTVIDDRLKLENALHQAFDPEDNRILSAAVQPKEGQK
jgi:CRISPR system Cascade subunit CasA